EPKAGLLHQLTLRRLDLLQQAGAIGSDAIRAHAFSRRAELLQQALPPAVQRGDLLALGEQLLFDDLKRAVERPFRVLLGKVRVQGSRRAHFSSRKSFVSLRMIRVA